MYSSSFASRKVQLAKMGRIFWRSDRLGRASEIFSAKGEAKRSPTARVACYMLDYWLVGAWVDDEFDSFIGTLQPATPPRLLGFGGQETGRQHRI